MISTRILDNDMGKVMKVPLTGRGTVHGITVQIDDKKLPEIDMGLLELLSADMGTKRFTEHCEEHLGNEALEKLFISAYVAYVTPINKSKPRY